LHIVAGIAAMVLTAALGTAMGLTNTASFMSGCVAFVAVSKGMDSYFARRRRAAATRLTERNPAARSAERESAEGRGNAALALDADTPERDGRN
jgi:hypothetical protein